jgi:hypothetical protein
MSILKKEGVFAHPLFLFYKGFNYRRKSRVSKLVQKPSRLVSI